MFIFQVFKIQKMIRDGKENPSMLASEEAGDLVKGIFMIPLILVGTSAVVSFLLGYTSIIFGLGPFGFFKFLFWILIIISIVVYAIMRKITSISQSIAQKTTNNIIDL